MRVALIRRHAIQRNSMRLTEECAVIGSSMPRVAFRVAVLGAHRGGNHGGPGLAVVTDPSIQLVADLRHTVASHAVMSGENLPQVGKLLGHRRHRTTAGYAHLADGHLVDAAERVGSLIAKAMAGQIAPR